MATRFIERNASPTAVPGDTAGNVAPIGIDSDSEELKYYDRTTSADRTVVTTDQAQTLTNKTLTSPTITNPTISAPTPVTDTTGTVALGSTHANRTTVLSKAAGGTVTLPAATGTGNKYRLVIGTSITSVSWVVSKTGDDTFFGGVFINDTGDTTAATADFYPAASGNNTLTLAFAAGAAKKGDYVEFEDIAADCWAVQGVLQGEVDPTNPFSTV